MPSRERKEEYFTRMEGLMDEYSKVLIVHADHVGSLQMQKIRIALRGLAVVLMGKNTMIRKIIGNYIRKNPGSPYDLLLPCVRGNIGFIFTNGDLGKVREVIDENRVPAAARVGVMAECDVVVPPGPTGCDPGQTSWFQALNVPTKISRGQIEIISELRLVTKGERVGGSEAALLQKLCIRPFSYGLVLKQVFADGSVFDAAVLDISEDDLKNKFLNAVRRIAALSLEIGFPTLAAVPHQLGTAVKRMIAIAVEIGYTFEAAEPWNALLNMSPEELAALQAASGGGGGGGGAEEEEKKEEEEEEEIDMGGGGGLFGGDEDAY